MEKVEKTEVKQPVKIIPERDYYKILLVGQSGKGKSYSFRNMNPETTGFINVEDKPLPFKNKFKHHKRINAYTEVFSTIIEYVKNPEINAICIDSLSAFMELILVEARKTKRNFDIWNMYNEEIGKFLTYVKKVPKEVFLTAHYEILGIEGAQEKRVKVKGKEFESQIEKEFTMVLYADSKTGENGKPKYSLNLYQEGTSAKCPPGIFDDNSLTIDNDSNFILNKVLDFVK